MSKSTTIFVCTNCGFRAQRWQGKCPNCGEWNTLTEQRTVVASKGAKPAMAAKPVDLGSIETGESARFFSGINEFDEVVGGGFVPGSLVLLGGDPGIGKSTLALQISLKLADSVLYVSGEESVHQIKYRANRLDSKHELQVLSETDLDAVLASAEAIQPKLVILDSVQTMYSEGATGVAGGVAQVTNAVQRIMRLAKQMQITFLIIGHVTKEGFLAGPKTLEHMVDTVLYLEGERFASFRILRCVKNRFGTTNEVGVFEMSGEGMVEVKNPSQLFLSDEQLSASGNCVTAVLEGSRALLLEIQALTSVSNFGYPKRTTAGFDNNRLQLITAILAKRAGINLSNQDIYINVAGGVKITEPAGDLAVALAIVSSLKDITLDGTVILGELGLSGEVRFVSNLEKRIREVEKLGFKRVICPRSRSAIKAGKLEVVQVRTLAEAIKEI